MREAVAKASFTSSPYAPALSIARDRLWSSPALSFCPATSSSRGKGHCFPIHFHTHSFVLYTFQRHMPIFRATKQSLILAGKF